MPPDRDPLAAELAGIRDRASQITDGHDVAECIADLGGPCSGHDAERLADVVEKVLALAHPGPIYVSDEAVWDWTLDPATLREAITSKLLSEGESDG